MITVDKIFRTGGNVKENLSQEVIVNMLKYPKLLRGKFIKRYKRFFTDVLLDGSVITAHNPNTGSMKCIVQEGRDVLLSMSDNPKRSLKYTVEGFLVEDRWALTNTILMNRIVRSGLLDNEIEELRDITELKSEYVYGDGRIDFYGINAGGKFLAEVKNVTLFDDTHVMFPDAVTERGRKHIGLLMRAKDEGFRPFMIYVCQVKRPYFGPAYDIDQKYAETLKEAVDNGLNVITVLTDFNEDKAEVRLVKGPEFKLR